MGYYRWFNHEKVTVAEISESLGVDCQRHLGGRHVLAISDSSEINLQAHHGRLKPNGVGVVGNNQDVGFFIHPTLVVESEAGLPLGLSTVQVWSRPTHPRARPFRSRCDGRLQPATAGLPGAVEPQPQWTDPKIAKSLSPLLVGVGGLVDCPSRWMVRVSKSKTSGYHHLLSRITDL